MIPMIVADILAGRVPNWRFQEAVHTLGRWAAYLILLTGSIITLTLVISCYSNQS